MKAARSFGGIPMLFGGLLVGWGLALILIAFAGSSLQTTWTTLQQIAPSWLWGTLILSVGLSLLYRSSRTFSSSYRQLDSANPNSRNEYKSRPQTSYPNQIQQTSQPSPTTIVRATSTLRKRRATPSHQKKSGADGPKIVAIGGGTGMPQLLRGLREYTDNITAIVTVADDGGSSGRLRVMGVLPPGDFRNNIAALSDSEDLITRLFQYRFAQSQLAAANDDPSGLAGHNFGNLFIATMAAVTGSFEAGLTESSRVLAVRGRVLPSTLEQVTLCAEVRREKSAGIAGGNDAGTTGSEWVLVEGESKIPEAGGTIQRVFLRPQSPRAYPEAVRAILQADLILAGPGSFFTSIMPNLLVPAVRDAILASSAPSLYLCNVATQPGETDYYTVSTHMHQLRLHAGDAISNVLANNVYDLATEPSPQSQWVTLPRDVISSGMVSDTVDGRVIEYRLFIGDLVNEAIPSMHDSHKLAAQVMTAYGELKEETGVEGTATQKVR